MRSISGVVTVQGAEWPRKLGGRQAGGGGQAHDTLERVVRQRVHAPELALSAHRAGIIDLTPELISSLPALNRGLYQAVTSARGVLTRRKKAVLGITLRLAGSQTCTITHRRTAEAH